MNTLVVNGLPENGDVQKVEGGDMAPLSEALVFTSQMRDKIEKIAGDLGRLKLSDFFNGLQDVSFDSEEYDDEQMKEFMLRWLSIIERSQDLCWDDYTERRIIDRFYDIIANISKSPDVSKYATNPVIWSMILWLSKNQGNRGDDKYTGIPTKRIELIKMFSDGCIFNAFHVSNLGTIRDKIREMDKDEFAFLLGSIALQMQEKSVFNDKDLQELTSSYFTKNYNQSSALSRYRIFIELIKSPEGALLRSEDGTYSFFHPVVQEFSIARNIVLGNQSKYEEGGLEKHRRRIKQYIDKYWSDGWWKEIFTLASEFEEYSRAFIWMGETEATVDIDELLLSKFRNNKYGYPLR